jgi:4-amino-4-deoxy-L-arabinose transferase-like glycosyltransferase
MDLTGHWVPGNFHPALVSPVLYLVQLEAFRAFGSSLTAARSISVCASLVSVLALGAAASLVWDLRTGRYAAVFLGLSAPFVFYSKLALIEPLAVMLVVVAYALGFASHKANGPKALQLAAVSGLFLALALICKASTVLCVPGLAWLLARSGWRKCVSAVGAASICCAGYFVCWYLPNQADIRRLSHYYLMHQYLPHSVAGIVGSLKRNLITGQHDGLIPYLARTDLPLFLIFLIGVVLMSRRGKTAVEEAIGIWIAVPVAAVLMMPYAPSRLFMLFWPPMALVCARALLAPVRADFAGAWMAPLVLAIFCVWNISRINASVNAATSGEYVQGDMLDNRFPEGTAIGEFAPTLFMDGGMTTVPLQPGLTNDRSPVETFHPTVIVVTRSPYWQTWWRKRYPWLITKKHLSKSVYVGRRYIEDVYQVQP